MRIEDTTGNELIGGNAAVYWNNIIIGYSEVEEKNNHSMNLYNWFASKDGYLGFIPDSYAGDPNADVKYPKWPIDYLSIKKDSDFDFENQRIDDLKPYINNHIVFSVIPVALSGKYGIEKQSKEIYVMGPPVLGTNLTFHFDPYTLRNNSGVFYKDGTSITKDNYWKDYAVNKNFKPTYVNNNKIMLIEYKEDGRAVLFEDSEASFSHNPTNSNNFTVFVVYKNNKSSYVSDQNIVKRSSSTKNGWELFLNRDKKLVFRINSNSTQSKSVIQTDDTKPNEKYIITARMQSNNMKLILDAAGIWGATVSNTFSYSKNDTSVSMVLGSESSNENIYEIIIYNTALSDGDVNEVRDYLAKKHRISL